MRGGGWAGGSNVRGRALVEVGWRFRFRVTSSGRCQGYTLDLRCRVWG